MQLRPQGMLLAVLSLGLVVLLVYLDWGQRSPGPLAAAHFQEQKLRGSAGCYHCHGDEKTSMTASCLACHQSIQLQLDQSAGIHGTLQDGLEQQCHTCHTDHHGHNFSMLGERSWTLASLPPVAEYKHDGLDFQLSGKHLELECKDCHQDADLPVLAKGKPRFLGQSQDCVHCHEDPHDGKLADCADCHGQEHSFTSVANFEHDERFLLQDSHAGVACKDCHKQEEDFSIDNVAERKKVRACADCHNSPHMQDFSQDCSSCHQVAHADFNDPAIKFSVDDHEQTGFSLQAPHKDLECKQCHNSEQETAFSSRYSGRQAEDCQACHEDPHQQQFQHANLQEQSCVDCHYRLHFRPANFPLAMHDETDFPLTGSHQAVGCNECHKQKKGQEWRSYHGTSADCKDCHEDVHNGSFDRKGLPKKVKGAAGCARCHNTESFTQVDRKRFDHGQWADYALHGAHATASCKDCHKTEAPASKVCADCHQDPHAGQFRQGKQTDCSKCHQDSSSFDTLSFDHRRDSSFDPSRNHGDLECSACHRSYYLPGGKSLVRYKPLGTGCTDCHGDYGDDSNRRRQR